ncbi:IS5/IS1182 family transposase, partial [Salmonella enterica subsp. enterica serovar Typhimurium]
GPRDKYQINFTDPQSRIMPVTGKVFDQCYNAQAAVDTESLLVTHVHVTQATNDKQQVMPLLTAWQGYPETLGKPDHLLGDTG